MIRFLVIRFLFPLLVFFLVRSLLKSVMASVRTYTASPPQRQAPQPPAVPAGGELKKDPVCGTYVSTSGSLSRTVNGQVVYFCSPQCRDRYEVA
jgi:YHS domain-containing protein